MTTSTAIAFRDALCDRDFDSVKGLLADDAAMRALLPPRILDVTGRDEILGWLTKWFAGGAGFAVLARADDTTAGRTRVTYRFRFDGHPVSGDPGVHEIEQTVFVDATDGVITRLDLLCSGFRPV